MNKRTVLIAFLAVLTILSSCETEEQKKRREAVENQRRIELEAKREKEQKEMALKLEQEKKEKAIHDKYINNSLRTGATPYSYCYGTNRTCSDYGCSQIKVKTPFNSDVLVTIKRHNKVYRHAYIKAGSSYTFEFPNGVYQPFFYYGKGWNPEKIMKETNSGIIKGGFVANEHFGKDSPQSLDNNILQYELILQQNGNFQTKPSNPQEAF